MKAAPSGPTITICSSCNFYEHVMKLSRELEVMGYKTLVPETAIEMERRNDYDVSHYKTWFAREGDYPEKARKIREHLKEVSRGDAILVVNDTKHGLEHYIGGNVLMEMGLAFWLNKPIIILNGIPEESKFIEEIKGMLPVVLRGRLDDLPKHLPLT